jgi:Outer membrane protein beta-barrel domain
MKTLLCLLISIFFFFETPHAQVSRISAGACLEVVFPVGGDFSNGSSTGYGFTVNMDYDLNVLPLTLTGNLGYLHFGSKSGSNNVFGSYVGESANVVPLLAGVKYYFIPGFGLYGTALIGVEFFSFSNNYTPPTSLASTRITYSTQSTTENKFAFGLGAGYEVPLSIPGSLDFSMRFMIINEANTFNIRAGYIYRF